MVELPPNVAEFNVLAGLILAKLYRSFPVLLQLEPEEFATEMGISALQQTLGTAIAERGASGNLSGIR